MLRPRRLLLALAGTCLTLASGAAADPADNRFTAISTPSLVRLAPASPPSYTITLTNDPSPSDQADRATIVPPPGFQVVGQPLDPTMSGCDPAGNWDAQVLPGGTISLARTGGAANNLCPGGSLTVVFSATAADPGSYVWGVELRRGQSVDGPPFTLHDAQLTVIVDGTPPATTIDDGPPPLTNSTSASFAFSSEAGATFECRLDGAAFSACTSPKSYTGLPGGDRTFAVRAIDGAGNTDPTPATHSWRIDLNGPPTTILSGPPIATNSRSASFTYSSETGAKFECSLDGALFSACPVGYDNLGDGPHVFAVRAIDSANNTGPAASYGWTIDTRPPTTAIAAGPAALGNTRSAMFAFSADEPSSFRCQLDGGGLQACSSPASYQGLSDGAHTFVVTPTDAVGNIGATSSYSWTIDATAPEVTVTSGPRSGTTTVSATFRFAANEPVSFECKLDAAVFAPCASPKSYARLKRGQHSFTVRATDVVGNVDATPAAHRWTISAPRTVKKTSALLSPLPGARVSSPPLLRWRRDARARFYNVQLFRGRVKVLSAWPSATSLRLRARWTYLGRQRTLSPGPYRWYVWPAYRGNRYGRLLGQSTFIVMTR